jgi:glycerol-3-phosphate acyltransferase PlsY
MVVVVYLITILIAYLIGAIPTGYLVVKRLTGQDIREHGSGGTGATNVRRLAGNQAALFVMFVDFHKGLIPTILAKLFFPELFWLHTLAAFAAIIGHSKSIFLRFAGGKSAATGLGTLIALNWPTGLVVGLAAFVLVKLTRIQSIGSMGAAILGVLSMWLFHGPFGKIAFAPLAYVIYAFLAASYVVIMHKANIVRLINGTENRIS